MRWRLMATWLLGMLVMAGGPAVLADDEPGPVAAAEVTLGRPADFRRDVLPILQGKCLACHSASTEEGGLVLESPETILKGGDSGPALVAGRPDESLLIHSAARQEDASPMPPLPNDANAKPLTPRELGLLRLWIREGAKGSGQSQRMISWQPLPEAIDAVYSLVLDSDEQLIAAGRGNRIHLYDIIRQRELAVLDDPGLAGDGASVPVAHRDIVSSLAFSPDGQWLASGGYRTVKLWQRRSPHQGRRPTGAAATAIALSPDGRWLAAGLEDGTVQIRDRRADAVGPTITAGDAAMTALGFHPESGRLITATGAMLTEWDVETGQAHGQVTTPAPIRALLWAADGNRLATGHDDGVVRIWNQSQFDGSTETPAAPAQELTGHSQPITSLARATDEGPRLASGSEDGTLRLWDLEQSKQVRQIAHGSPVSVVAASADGTHLASAGPDGIVRVWDIKGAKVAELSGDPRPAIRLARLQQDQQVAQSRKSLADKAVADAEKGVQEREESLKKAQEQVNKAQKAVADARSKVEAAQKKVDEETASLTEMPDDEGRKKAKADAEAALAKEHEALKKAEDSLTSANRGAELSQQSLATMKANLDQHKKRQEAETDREAEATAAVKAAREQKQPPAAAASGLVFAPDGSWLAVADRAGRIVIWHAESQRALDVFTTEPPAAITSLAMTGDGTLLSSTADGHFDTWNVEPKFTLAGHLGPADEDGLDVSTSPIADRVLAIDFSPDGALLALGSGVPSRSGQLQVWNVAERSLVREIADAHSDTVFDVAFSRDGTRLASGGADKFARVFDLATGELQQSFEGHTGHVLSVAWKADGSVLATGGADNDIKAWTTATGQQQRTISSHTKPVNAIAFVGIEEKLVSAAGDKAVLLHTVSNGRNYRRLGGASDFLHAVAVSRDESRVIAGCEDGLVRVWDGTNGKLLMSFPGQ